jgi:hypothetical protein
MPSTFPTAFWQEQVAVAGPPPDPNAAPIVQPTYLVLYPEEEQPITVNNLQAASCTINWTASGQWQYLGLDSREFTSIVPASAQNFFVFSVLNNRGFDVGNRPVFEAYINGNWRINDITGSMTRIRIRLI